ncbi:hypothetical protein COOONC_23692 [Cooperia oncophora]
MFSANALAVHPVDKAELEVEEASSHVYHVKLNRPDRRNTFTLELWKEMKSTFDKLADEPKCRAIVLSGNGKSFCAGIDLQQGMGVCYVVYFRIVFLCTDGEKLNNAGTNRKV